MSKHTPAPWEVVRRTNSHLEIEAPNQIGYSAKKIATLSATNFEANARLIAAAPDLLAELHRIVDANPRLWDEDMRDQFEQWAKNRARAAIAKVEGVNHDV